MIAKGYITQVQGTWVSHEVDGILLNLAFYTEELDGFGDTVNIFLLHDLYLYIRLEVEIVSRWWQHTNHL